MPIGSSGSLVFISGRGLKPQPMGNLCLPFNQPARYVISGVTKDSAGSPLGGCTVEVYEALPDATEQNQHGTLRGVTVSDAAGNYSLDVTSDETGLKFQAKAYLAGSPDVAGVTVNTLVGVPS